MYKIEFSPKARKQLKGIKKKDSKYDVALVIEELKTDPSIGKPLTRELLGQMSYKIGNYRVIYKINKKDKLVYIVKIGPRPTVYD